MKKTLRARLLALLTFAAILCLCCAGAFAAGTTMNVSVCQPLFGKEGLTDTCNTYIMPT